MYFSQKFRDRCMIAGIGMMMPIQKDVRLEEIYESKLKAVKELEHKHEEMLRLSRRVLSWLQEHLEEKSSRKAS